MYRQGTPITVGTVSIANVHHGPPGPPAPVNGQVMCTLHKKSRAIKFVQPKAITNAEGTVVGYTYHCTDASPCITGPTRSGAPAAEAKAVVDVDAEGSDFDIDAPSKGSDDGRPPAAAMKKLGYDGVRTTTTGSAAAAGGLAAIMAEAGGAPKGLFGDSSNVTSPTDDGNKGRFAVGTGAVTGRPPSRYYDMTKQRGDDDYKKVCWSCGMDSHEKPQCPNLLCRNCHDAQEPGYEGRMNHRCTRVGLSAFVLLDTDFLDNFMAAEELQKKISAATSASEVDGATEKAKSNPLLTLDEAAFVNPSMLTVRCPRCNQFGHMDCPHPLSTHTINRAIKLNDKKSKARLEKEEKESGLQRQLSCCGCASKDHSGYECPLRPRDYWRERVLVSATSQLGVTELRKIIAIDERMPQNGLSGGGGNPHNSASGNSNIVGGGSANYNNGGSTRPFGANSAYAPRTGGGAPRRGRDDESDDWSDDDGRPARGGRRGEYDRSYNRNSNNNRREDDSDDYSLDSWSDDSGEGNNNRRGGNNNNRRGAGRERNDYGRARHHTPHYARLDARDHGRNTPSAPRGGGGGYSNSNLSRGGNSSSGYANTNSSSYGTSNTSSSSNNRGGPSSSYGGNSSYQRPAAQQQQSAYSRPPPPPHQQQQFRGGAPNSYSAPYGNQQQHHHHQHQQQQGGYSYSRPQQPPPPNSQPGRGAYNKRGFEF